MTTYRASYVAAEADAATIAHPTPCIATFPLTCANEKVAVDLQGAIREMAHDGDKREMAL
jgi:hypothetical protein